MTDPTVLVVGAGPTGLLLAAELLRRDVDCLLIDAASEPSVWDRATIVHPRSLEMFESLGLVNQFLLHGVKQHFARLHSAGSVLGEIDLSLCGSRYQHNVGISEEMTESILADYLGRQGGHVVRSSRLVGLAQDDLYVRATIESAGTKRIVTARWIVACDGYHSTAREQCGIALEGCDEADPWAVFDATLVGWRDSHEAIYGYLDAVPVILTSLPQSRWRVYLRPSGPESDLIADATTTLAPYFPSLALADVTNPTRFRCHAKVAARFRLGRVLLAGDAAHVCSPSQGHGMNSGLQDAFNLAWKLAHVCHGQSHPDLLDSYEAERRPVAKKNATTGQEFERAQDITDPQQRRERDETLKATFANPATSYRESVAEAELDIDYCASPIVMGDSHAAISPGHRLPDSIRVSRPDGTACGLDELTHRAGHTALLLGGTAASADQLARLADSLATPERSPFVAETAVVAVNSKPDCSSFQWTPAAAEQLGVSEVTLLAIRPDGHVGLRADRDHLPALAEYTRTLKAGRATDGQRP